MLAGFRFTKIVIVESLERGFEQLTGTLLHEHILRIKGIAVPIELRHCESAPEFRVLVAGLIEDCRRGHKPLLHIECHGDEHEGLEFENGSILSWPELSEILGELNEASRFNLFACFSACFGAYLLGQMNAFEPPPCFGFLAPTGRTYPDELLQGFKDFYTIVLKELDTGSAFSRLRQMRLVEGRWFAETAETWFEKVVTGYVRNHCTRKLLRIRVKRIYRERIAEQRRESIGHLKRGMHRRNKTALVGDYFDRFFAVAHIPENVDRFSAARTRVETALRSLWCSADYRL